MKLMPTKIPKIYEIEKQNELPMTLDEIGANLGLTRERVRQILNSAMYKADLELQKRNLRFDDIF